MGTSGRRDVAKSPGPGVRAGTEDVLGRRVRPAAGGAQPTVSGVDVDDRLGDGDDVDVVGRGCEVVGSMVRHGDLAWLVELDTGAAAGRVSQLEPAHAGVAAVFLWADVRDVLVRDGRLPDADQPGPLPVRVRLMGTGAEPAERFGSGPDLDGGPHPGKVGHDLRDVGCLND